MQAHSSDDAQRPDADQTLAHARSAILRYLAERDGPVENLSLVTTAVRTAELEGSGPDPEDLSFPEVHERVTTQFLPDLDRDGLVAYDRAAGTVSLAVPRDELDDVVRQS